MSLWEAALLCLFFGIVVCENENEKSILVQFYTETSVKRNWKIQWNLSTPYCTWFGVTCEGGTVTALDLKNSGLNGNIPPIISSLQKLSFLDLSENSLVGTIPSEIFSLSGLKSLHLGNNKFSGQIPDTIGMLSNLKELILVNNRFDGDISFVRNLTNIQIVALANNKFSGSIAVPSSANILELRYQLNELTGTLPPELFVPSLKILRLGRNPLVGTLPLWFANMTNLIELEVGQNHLEGPVDHVMHEPLWLLSINDNNFYGTLPIMLIEISFGLNYFVCPVVSTPQLKTEIGSCAGYLQNDILASCTFYVVCCFVVTVVAVGVHIKHYFTTKTLPSKEVEREHAMTSYCRNLISRSTILAFLQLPLVVVNFAATLHCNDTVCPRFQYKDHFSIFMPGNLGPTPPFWIHGVCVTASLLCFWLSSRQWTLSSRQRTQKVAKDSVLVICGLPPNFENNVLASFLELDAGVDVTRWRETEGLVLSLTAEKERLHKLEQVAVPRRWYGRVLHWMRLEVDRDVLEEQLRLVSDRLAALETTAVNTSYVTLTVPQTEVSRLVKAHPPSFFRFLFSRKQRFQDHFLEIYTLPSVSDMVHHNLQRSFVNRKLRFLFCQVLNLMIVFIFSLVAVAMLAVKSYVKAFSAEYLRYPITLLCALTFLGTNQIIEMQLWARYEGHVLESLRRKKSIHKAVVSQLITSVIVISKMDILGVQVRFYAADGTAAQLVFFFFVNFLRLNLKLLGYVIFAHIKRYRQIHNGVPALVEWELPVDDLYIDVSFAFFSTVLFLPAFPPLASILLFSLVAHFVLLRVSLFHPRYKVFSPPTKDVLRLMSGFSITRVTFYWAALMALMLLVYGPWLDWTDDLSERVMRIMKSQSRFAMEFWTYLRIIYTPNMVGLPPAESIFAHSTAGSFVIVLLLFFILQLHPLLVVSTVLYFSVPYLANTCLTFVVVPVSLDWFFCWLLPLLYPTSGISRLPFLKAVWRKGFALVGLSSGELDDNPGEIPMRLISYSRTESSATFPPGYDEIRRHLNTSSSSHMESGLGCPSDALPLSPVGIGERDLNSRDEMTGQDAQSSGVHHRTASDDDANVHRHTTEDGDANVHHHTASDGDANVHHHTTGHAAQRSSIHRAGDAGRSPHSQHDNSATSVLLDDDSLGSVLAL